jgi:hypothetical protein
VLRSVDASRPGLLALSDDLLLCRSASSTSDIAMFVRLGSTWEAAPTLRRPLGASGSLLSLSLDLESGSIAVVALFDVPVVFARVSSNALAPWQAVRVPSPGRTALAASLSAGVLTLVLNAATTGGVADVAVGLVGVCTPSIPQAPDTAAAGSGDPVDPARDGDTVGLCTVDVRPLTRIVPMQGCVPAFMHACFVSCAVSPAALAPFSLPGSLFSPWLPFLSVSPPHSLSLTLSLS